MRDYDNQIKDLLYERREFIDNFNFRKDFDEDDYIEKVYSYTKKLKNLQKKKKRKENLLLYSVIFMTLFLIGYVYLLLRN